MKLIKLRIIKIIMIYYCVNIKIEIKKKKLIKNIKLEGFYKKKKKFFWLVKSLKIYFMIKIFLILYWKFKYF